MEQNTAEEVAARSSEACQTRAVASKEEAAFRAERERPLSEKVEARHIAEVAAEKDYLSKPWRQNAKGSVSVRVPPDGYPGQRLTVKLTDGRLIHPTVPTGCRPGDCFSAPVEPDKPEVRGIGGGAPPCSLAESSATPSLNRAVTTQYSPTMLRLAMQDTAY